MTDFEVTVLGCSSATPTSNRNPSAQLIQMLGRYFLVDCGEGTQIQMRRFKTRFQKIDRIFISHLHGDHYLGLMGFIQTLHLLNRTHELHLYAPLPLKEMLDVQFKYSETTLRFPLHFHALNTNKEEILFEDQLVEIRSFPLKHRIACCGFIFKEKKKELSIRKEQLETYKIPVASIHGIKNGEDFQLENGQVIPNSMLVFPPKPLKSYAYCSDTIYNPGIVPFIKDVTLLYHESTFLEGQKARAKETFHTTAKEAADIAKQANAGSLMLGHFSARYGELDLFITEASEVFSNVFIAEEGKTYTV